MVVWDHMPINIANIKKEKEMVRLKLYHIICLISNNNILKSELDFRNCL